MRFLIILFAAILLTGCSVSNDEMISAPLTTGESLSETQECTLPQNVVDVQQFFSFIPGEATMNDVYQLLLNTDEELLHLHPSGLGWRFEVQVDNSRLLTFDCASDRTVLAISYTLADRDAFVASNKDKGLYDEEIREIPDYMLAIADTADQQSAKAAQAVSIESFSNIVPGKSTIEDIYQIVKRSGIQECAKIASVRGWWIELPAGNGKIISVELDSNYTVISITYQLEDISGWFDSNINNN